MRNFTGLATQVEHALKSNDEKRRKLTQLLNTKPDENDTVPVDVEVISSLYARLGNDSLIMQKLLDEVRILQAAIHITNQQ